MINSSSTESFILSSNDWILGPYFTHRYVYFYDIKQWSKYEQDSNEMFMNVEHLKTSLKKLLEYYPMIAGRFKCQADNTMMIEGDDGVPFVSASTNIALTDLPLSSKEYSCISDHPESLQLINPPDYIKPIEQPLFQIQHTRFTCGSVALGIHLHHYVADAQGYIQLIRDWAQLYKNPSFRPVVCHDRSLMMPTTAQLNQMKCRPDFDKPKPEFMGQTIDPHQPPSTLKIFRFGADELKKMKIAATEQLTKSDVAFVSTFDVLSAHLAHHVTLARHKCGGTTNIAQINIVTNTRTRINPPLPQNYFGNAILSSSLELEIEKIICEDNLGLLSSKIHQTIEEKTSDRIQETLAWIVVQPDKSKIWATFQWQRDLLITAWNKMGQYINFAFELDVAPKRITKPFGDILVGSAYFFATETNDESIDVMLSLTQEQMNNLEGNQKFRSYQ